MSRPANAISEISRRCEWGRFSEVKVTVAADAGDRELARAAAAIERELGVSRVTASVLAARGIAEPSAARTFLAPALKSDLPDPGQIKNISEAAGMILEAVRAGRRITIYHDFDVDGLTAGAQLLLYLRALGAEARCYVPNRFVEGYGLSLDAVRKVAGAGTELLITVDCGISAHDELALAGKLGMKTIVLDHHEPAGLPPADVIVDPAQEGCPFREYKLAAAGLVWMLLIVLRRKAHGVLDAKPPDPKDYLDLAAIGTICDMVPLTAVNRLIAHRGIDAVRATSRIGLRALLDIAGLHGAPRFGAGHISFGIGPRINAAGRLEDASAVGELLTTTDSRKAKRLAQSIDRLNTRRRAVEEEVRAACVQALSADSELMSLPAIALFGEDFHLGVIGIAAQRLVEEFHKPSAVMAPGEAVVGGRTERVIKGSVRSIEGFHVAEVLHELSPLLIGGGGHAAAGGFTIAADGLEAFQAAFVAAAEQRLSPEMLMRRRRADLQITLTEIDFTLAEELHRLAPFGVGNPSPVLVTENVSIETATSIQNKHLRLRFSDGKCSRGGVAWNFFGHPLLKRGEQVNIAYQVEINTYNGVSAVQLSLKEVWR